MACPWDMAGEKRQRDRASSAASSRRLNPDEFCTSDWLTCPSASTRKRKVTVPSSSSRREAAGYCGLAQLPLTNVAALSRELAEASAPVRVCAAVDVLGVAVEGSEGVATGAAEPGEAVTGVRAGASTGAVGSADGFAEGLAGEGAWLMAREVVLSAAGAEAPVCSSMTLTGGISSEGGVSGRPSPSTSHAGIKCNTKMRPATAARC